MKEYDVFELYVVGIMKNYDFKYFICTKENEEYVEIFKHNVIKVDDKSTIDAFAGYYKPSDLPKKLTRSEIFEKYSEINYINSLYKRDREELRMEKKLSFKVINGGKK